MHIVAERNSENLIMTTLLVGFDSAWTPNNSGALIGVFRLDAGAFREFGPPLIVDYPKLGSVGNGCREVIKRTPAFRWKNL